MNDKSNTQEQFERSSIEKLQLCKMYHVYERRNEWADWSGDTHLVSRSGKRLKQTLFEAETHAELSRKQGTKFFIDETPVLLCSNKLGTLAITELFTESPMSGATKALLDVAPCIKTPRDLINVLPKPQWLVTDFYKPQEKFQLVDLGTFFKRTSSPGNYLCWSLKISQIKKEHIESIIHCLKNKK